MRKKGWRALTAVLLAAAVVSLSLLLTPSSASAETVSLTVSSGTILSYGDVTCDPDTRSAEVPEGALVTISADTATSGAAFSCWSVAGDAVLSDIYSPQASFTMPTAADPSTPVSPITVTASFKEAATVANVTLANPVYGDPIAPDTDALSIQAGGADTGIGIAQCTLLYSGASYPSSPTPPKNVGDYVLTVVINSDQSYAGRQEIPFSITPAPIVITGITATDRPFDGTDRVALDVSSAAFDTAQTKIPADEQALISISTDATVYGTVSNGGAIGEDLDVTVSGVSCAFSGSALSGNYSVTVQKPTVSITGYTIAESDLVFTYYSGPTALSGESELVYDGVEKSVQVAPGSSLPSTLSFRVDNGTRTDAGDCTAVITFDDGSLVSGNYSLPAGGLQKVFSIGERTVSLVWQNDTATRVYNGSASALSAALADGARIDSDECTVTLTGHDAVNVGTHQAVASLTGDDSGNYVIAASDQTRDYTITQKPITLGTAAIAAKTYDGTTAGELSSIVFDGLCGNEALSAAQSDFTASVTFPQASVGSNLSVSVSITLGSTTLANNYTFLTADTVPAPTRSAQTSATGSIAAKPIAGALNVTLSSDANSNGAADPNDILSAAFVPAASSGAQPAAADLTYQWKRDGSAIATATASQYTLTSADAGKRITCTVSGTGNFTGSVDSTDGVSSALLPLPGTVSFNNVTALGQTLTASLSGGVPTSQYTWKWYRNSTEIASNGSASRVIAAEDLGTTITAKAIAITGTGAMYTGDHSGSILIPAGVPASPVIDLASDTGVISVTWNKPDSRGSAITGYLLSIKRAGTEISGSPFSLTADKTSFQLSNLTGGANYTATLTVMNSVGTAESNTPSVMVRAPYSGSTPDAPTRYSRTTSSVTLTPHNGYEYSRDGSSWQDSNTFKGLKAGKSYSFYQRVKETSTHDHSDSSPAYTTSTLSSSSSSSSSDDDDSSSSGSSSGTSSGSTSGTGTTTSSDTLYELSVTDSNTNILYSTMNKLIRGNAEKDVTIKYPRVTYTFAKGTMKAVTGRVWYDLGVLMDSCIHHASIRELAGTAHVLTIHFNYDSTLPGNATIRIYLGTQYAGQTLYYYKFDEAANKLAFQQNATVDAEGWASVTQTECSDYVLLNRDINTAAASPEPSASPAPTASAEPTSIPIELTAEPKKNKFDWQLAAIIGGAALVLLGILWLCLKKRADEDEDDEDDEDERYRY